MPISHTNRKQQIYFLHGGRTKTSRRKYFFSRKNDGNLPDEIPEGYEIYEKPSGQVYLRIAAERLVTDNEVEIVKAALPTEGRPSVTEQFAKEIGLFGSFRSILPKNDTPPFLVDVNGKDIVVHEATGSSTHPMLKFSLIDKKTREFATSRWCFRGSIDDWIAISPSGTLPELVKAYCPHLGKESLFDLM